MFFSDADPESGTCQRSFGRIAKMRALFPRSIWEIRLSSHSSHGAFAVLQHEMPALAQFCE
jgi:hypothetical protein